MVIYDLYMDMYDHKNIWLYMIGFSRETVMWYFKSYKKYVCITYNKIYIYIHVHNSHSS